MVKIYTRKGDDGTTSLWYGGRVAKDDLHTEAYGTLDEANSVLGLARARCTDQRLAADILRLQDELFVAGAELATGPEARDRLEPGVTRLEDDMIAWLEGRIDAYMAEVNLPPKFVIPGGNELSAQLDVARSVLRRAERRIVALQRAGAIEGSAALRYVNRASDLLFAMSRFADVPEPELFEGRGRSTGKAHE
jgi:cob(I)alamin adenosyltransferase